MRTNIVIDDDLVAEAMLVSGAKTKKEAVDLALRALVEERRRRGLRDLRGKLKFAAGYDPHATRTR